MSRPQQPSPEAAGEAVDPRDLAPQRVLPLVVRVERADPPARTDALEAAAIAVLTLLADPRAHPAPPHPPPGEPAAGPVGEPPAAGLVGGPVAGPVGEPPAAGVVGEPPAAGLVGEPPTAGVVGGPVAAAAGEPRLPAEPPPVPAGPGGGEPSTVPGAGGEPAIGAGVNGAPGGAGGGPRPGEWADAVREWADARIRKVVRRARGAEWRRAAALPGITVTHRTAEVRVFPPVPLDGWPRDLARLQVSGTDLADPAPPPAPVPGVPVLWLNPHLELTAGKAMAQVGHAAQLGWNALATPDQDRWRAAGFPLAVRTAAPAAWPALERSGLPLVRDAGFTEIAPGTCTAVADHPALPRRPSA